MKRTLILAALAALTFASCQKNEVAVETGAESNAITFDVYSGRSVTKATNVIGIDTLKKYGLGVFAFYTATSDYDKTTDKVPNFMNNQQVKYNDNTSKWEYSPIKYWPNNTDDKISFFAYAPYHDGTTWDASNPYLSFTVKEKVYGQEDLLFAPALKNMTKQSGRDSLKFSFKHALSKIGFKVAYVRDSTTFALAGGKKIEDSTKIVIDTLILEPKGSIFSGFFKKGKVDMTADNAAAAWIPDSTEYYSNFTLDSVNFYKPVAATDTSAKGQIVTATRDTLNNESSYMMIIPQDFSTTTDSLNVTVHYHVWTMDHKLADNISKIKNVITTNQKIKFEAGKQYTLHLLLGMNSVKIKTEVAAWESTDSTDIYLPVNK